MARPIKNYCDYFPHDRDMRNHRKVKAIRNKFGMEGYGIWNMLLEFLTGINGNAFDDSDVEFELLAGDFGVSATEIRSVVSYAIHLELLYLKEGVIYSESLDERLKVVYDKRDDSKSKSEQQSRTNGRFGKKNTERTVVSVAETPQIKVNKSKVKETINKKPFNTMAVKEDFNGLPQHTMEAAYELIFRTSRVKVSDESLIAMWEVFKKQNLDGGTYFANEGKVYSYYINWVKTQKFDNGTTNQSNASGVGRAIEFDNA